MISKRQVLDVCNALYIQDKKRYTKPTKKGDEFNQTLMANDLIFQLAIDTNQYETALSMVGQWWQESSYNSANKKFKA
jgi:hypothetical protein